MTVQLDIRDVASEGLWRGDPGTLAAPVDELAQPDLAFAPSVPVAS